MGRDHLEMADYRFVAAAALRNAIRKTLAVIIVITPLGAADADAQLQFERHPTSNGDIITLSGSIARRDGNRFAAYLERIGFRPGSRLRLSLNSPGGDAQEAYEIAGSLKEGLVTTIVTGRAVCYSACFLLFIAGHDRMTGPQAQIGIHSTSETNGHESRDTYAATMIIARQAAEWGVPEKLIGKLVSTPPWGISILSQSELRSRNVHILPELDRAEP
jgi:hypothetical protein